MFHTMEGLMAAVLYGVISTAMAFLNKALLSSYNFNQPVLILVVQMGFGILAIEILRCMQVVSLSRYTFTKGKVMWLASFCCTLHSVLALIALEGMNIPMYAVIKRCTPLVNLILAVVFLRKPVPSCFIIFSIVLITIGCVIAGFGDFSFDTFAYSIGGISVLIQGVYQTLIQKASEENLTTLEIFYLNSYNCFFYSAVSYLVMMVHELDIPTIPFNDKYFLLCFLTVTTMGVLLNYSLFLCTSLNSALTTSVVGILKSIIQMVVGFFVFGGVQVHPLNIIGMVLNTCGTITYSFGKFREPKTILKQSLV